MSKVIIVAAKQTLFNKRQLPDNFSDLSSDVECISHDDFDKNSNIYDGSKLDKNKDYFLVKHDFYKNSYVDLASEKSNNLEEDLALTLEEIFIDMGAKRIKIEILNEINENKSTNKNFTSKLSNNAIECGFGSESGKKNYLSNKIFIDHEYNPQKLDSKDFKNKLENKGIDIEKLGVFKNIINKYIENNTFNKNIRSELETEYISEDLKSCKAKLGVSINSFNFSNNFISNENVSLKKKSYFKLEVEF